MAARRRFALIFPLLLTLPSLAAAQTALPQTADADAPSESHIQAALDLLNATHASENFQAVLASITPLETQQIKRAMPTLSDEAIVVIEKKLTDAVTARQDELARIQAIEYARHFDEQQLRDLTAFYRSDLGQKYVTALPAIIQETAPIVRQWITGVIGQAQQDIMRSLAKPGDKT